MEISVGNTILIGITGPSGSGKSTLSKQLEHYLVRAFPVVVVLVGEDPNSYFSGPVATPYSERDEATEKPSNVDWEMVQKQIDEAGQGNEDKSDGSKTVIIFEHFLLPFLPMIDRLVDHLIILDGGEKQDEETMKELRDFLRERRVSRNPNRTEQEKFHLRTYYDDSVWKTYISLTRPAILELANKLDNEKVLNIDPRSKEQALESAVSFLNKKF